MTDKEREYLIDASVDDEQQGECNRCGEKTYIAKYGMCEICASDMLDD